MPILSGSRYERVNLVLIATPTRTRVLMEDRDPLTLDDVDGEPIQLTVQEGDEIDELAFRFSGKHRLWWIIAEVNNLEFPYELESGTTLLIPPREFLARF